MTKQQTIELLEKQMPSFYSLDQVVNIIKDIEVGGGFNVEDLVSGIKEHILSRVEKLDSEDICEYRSAEFSLNYNEISLDSIDMDFEELGNKAICGLQDMIEEFIDRRPEIVG